MFQKCVGLRSKAEQLLFRGRVKWMSIHADYVFSFGGRISELLDRMNVSKEKQIEFPLGISRSWLSTEIVESNAPRKFVFIGRNERRKGIYEINQVLQTLEEEQHNFEMHFIGPVPLTLQHKSRRIKYYGQINEEKKLKDILKTCDVLVSASYSEGMPTVILEAMSQGLAILATDVGAVSKMVDEKNGKCILPGNTSALEAAFKFFIELSPADLDELKLNSLAKFEQNFISEDLIKSLVQILEQKSEEHKGHLQESN